MPTVVSTTARGSAAIDRHAHGDRAPTRDKQPKEGGVRYQPETPARALAGASVSVMAAEISPRNATAPFLDVLHARRTSPRSSAQVATGRQKLP